MYGITLQTLLADPAIRAIAIERYSDMIPADLLSRPASPATTITPNDWEETISDMETEKDSSPVHSSTTTSSGTEGSPNEGEFQKASTRKRKKARKNKAAKALKTNPDAEKALPTIPPLLATYFEEYGVPSPPGVVSPLPDTAHSQQGPVEATTATAPAGPKSPTPPPLYIRDKGKWLAISAWCNTNRVLYKSAKSTTQGIRVDVRTTDDHRALSNMLRDQNIPYHTYTMPEAKLIRAVVRNIPVEIGTEEIRTSLRGLDLPVQEVHRMIRGRGRLPMNMVLVCLTNSKEGKGIYKVTKICGLSGISVEPPYKTGNIAQCHKCQLYGHTSNNCYAHPRCVKCLGDHHTTECTRPKDRSLCTEPPSCVLCGEIGHPANYRGCPRAPRRMVPHNSRAKYYNKAFVPAPLPTQNAWHRPLAFAKEAFPALPQRQPLPSPPTTTRQVTSSLPPIAGHTKPTVGQLKPPMGLNSNKHFPPPVKAVNPPTPRASQGLDPDLALVMNLAALINYAEIREIAAELRRNEGNALALLNIATKYAPTIERLGAFNTNII